MSSRHSLTIIIILMFVLVSTTLFIPASRTAALEPAQDVVPRELLVKFSEHSTASLTVARSGARLVKDFPQVGWQLIRLPQGMNVTEGLALFNQSKAVVAAQPNFVYRIQAVPNDPRFPDLYAMRNTGQIGGTPGADIRAEQAWNTTTGSRSVVVAVNDLGVDYNHEDLNANMWRNPGETGLTVGGVDRSTNNVDDDGNGYVDDVYGIDTINHDSDPMDDGGHGTHVAGTIGAVGNNGAGVVGVNWDVSIMAVKTHNAAGNGTSASVVEGFQYEAMMRQRGVNIRVTNNSWGGAPEAPAFDQALKDAIDLAGNAGILNACAAGNNARNNDVTPFYPASYDSPSILAVAASDQNDNRALFSSWGLNSVHIAAPGVGITSTMRGNAYGPLSGTSMATPHVSGTAALLCGYNSLFTRTTLKNVLLNSVDVLPQWVGLTVTGGRLNALRALQAIPTTNVIDNADFFVRQHYFDFLSRDPDPGGQAYWTDRITTCGTDAICVRNRRIEVSAAFFIEQEFQRTGSFIYRMYKGGLGRRPTFAEFQTERMQIVEGPNLEQLKQAFALAFVQRTEFTNKYAGRDTAADFVDALIASIQQNSGIDLANQRNALITRYNSGANRNESRVLALREAIEQPIFFNGEYNPAFVIMEYFGYLGRDPDQGGYLFWLEVLNNRDPNNYRSMVCAFITSVEYQTRFAPVVTRTDSECGQ
jgi:subtilisin family serine protease